MRERKQPTSESPQLRAKYLSVPDFSWLDEVSEKEFTPDILPYANNLITDASVVLRGPNSNGRHERAIDAREEFYGEFLGWDHPESVGHKAYTFIKKSKFLRPPDKVISVMRNLWRAEINPHIIAFNPIVLNTPADQIIPRSINLRGHGIDPYFNPKLLMAKPETIDTSVEIMGTSKKGNNTIKYSLRPEVIRRRLDIGDRILQSFGLSLTARDVTEMQPSAISVNSSKYLFVARVYKDKYYLNNDPSQLTDAMIKLELHKAVQLPADSYLAAAALHETISYHVARHEQVQIPEERRRERSLTLIDHELERVEENAGDEAIEPLLSETLIRAYFRYSALTDDEAIQFPRLQKYIRE